MINKYIIKKITVIITIISLLLTFSFLVGFSNSRTQSLKGINNVNNFFGDSEENGNESENGSLRGKNIDDLISLVQEATSKHMEVLQEVLASAPHSSQKGIKQAIEVSIRGSIRAIEALTKIKNSNNGNEDSGQKTFHIISSCNRGGTIEPKGIQFSQGESIGFVISPEEGYELVWVRIDNEKMGTILSYSFDAIDSNHTIHAHFKKIKNSSDQNGEAD